MKILLIKPPSKNMLYVDQIEEVETERGFFPPLGLMYVASYLRENSDVDIKMIDMEVDRIDPDDLPVHINNFKPDIVGIQAITYTLIDTIKTAKKIKEIDNNIKLDNII